MVYHYCRNIFTVDIKTGDPFICNLVCTIGHYCRVENYVTLFDRCCNGEGVSICGQRSRERTALSVSHSDRMEDMEVPIVVVELDASVIEKYFMMVQDMKVWQH